MPDLTEVWFTADLDATVAWLQQCGITTVAMEATGIYWMALYDQLESAGLEVVLVEPHSVKQVPGRKSNVLDCQWLMQTAPGRQRRGGRHWPAHPGNHPEG